MKILALDCSTDGCSAALLTDNGQGNAEINQRFELAPRQHTQRILPLVQQLLADHETSINQLDAIAFGRGPGSFTGLRICLGTVQGLAFGADLPVLPISSLAAQAQQFITTERADNEALCTIFSTLDARMDEIYWGVFHCSATGLVLTGTERLTAPEQLLLPSDAGQDASIPRIIIGAGLNYRDRIAPLAQFCQQHPDSVPDAAAVAKLAQADFLQGKSCRADQAIPSYMRDEVAWQKQPPSM